MVGDILYKFNESRRQCGLESCYDIDFDICERNTKQEFIFRLKNQLYTSSQG